jgi:transcriptional regulator with XRE-family HTH domain
MKRSFYDEPDCTFGQAILTLRTNIGLTQSDLADLLGISRRAVGEWEAGNSYPKAERLKQLIYLCIKWQAFPAGHEAEAIRALWVASPQKTLLDEQWLAELLAQQLSPRPLTRLPLIEVAATGKPLSGPRVDWGEAPASPSFYGREQEMAQLTRWILQERCQIVSLLGMGGIGKSALAVNAMHRIAEHFAVVIFRSLRDAPPCEELLDDCFQVLAPQPLRVLPTSLERRISLLLEHLRASRILLVLDNLEGLLEVGNVQGHLRPGFEGYGRLLRQIGETTHQSCLLLTSREKPADLRPLEGKHAPVRSLRLARLDPTACKQLFTEKDVVGSQQEQARLAEV